LPRESILLKKGKGGDPSQKESNRKELLKRYTRKKKLRYGKSRLKKVEKNSARARNTLLTEKGIFSRGPKNTGGKKKVANSKRNTTSSRSSPLKGEISNENRKSAKENRGGNTIR